MTPAGGFVNGGWGEMQAKLALGFGEAVWAKAESEVETTGGPGLQPSPTSSPSSSLDSTHSQHSCRQIRPLKAV
jgi:hypothetical protein